MRVAHGRRLFRDTRTGAWIPDLSCEAPLGFAPCEAGFAEALSAEAGLRPEREAALARLDRLRLAQALCAAYEERSEERSP